jgi:general secretion pathway protein K
MSGLRSKQRGAAILLAMLTVVLVATMASAMLWQQWRAVEIESAQRTRVQSQWILTGALDWARLILSEDAREDARHGGGSDNLTEPWAVPLAPARLSTFLAAQQGQSLVGDDTDPSQEAFLSGEIEDLQSRLNVRSLIDDNNKVHEATLAAWTRLFKQLNLPQAELDMLVQQLLLASTKATPVSPGVGAAVPAENSTAHDTPLLPSRVDELGWLGLSETTLNTLAPFITLLPPPTTPATPTTHTLVNVNTAPMEVLMATVPNLSSSQARQLINARADKPFVTLMDVLLVLPDPKLHFDPAEQGVTSQFFSVTGRLRVGNSTVQEQSVLQRVGLLVKTLSRRRGQVTQAATP